MANPAGHPATLDPGARPGNSNRLSHGAYSPRVLSERATIVADAIMEAPHTVPLDRVAAEELASIVALCERLDAALEERPLDHATARNLLDLRLKASGRLERWLSKFGLTPDARAEWAARLAGSSGLGAEIRRRMEAVDP